VPYLEVLDSGPGVSDEQQRRLFEPFFTTSSKGTGLGLYLSRELCEFNRAKLSYHLREKGGSRFRITFSSKEASEKQWPIELH
jgi:two-component system sensor histidine kinase PilS (NtrC family)